MNQKRLCLTMAVDGRYVNTWIQYSTVQYDLFIYQQTDRVKSFYTKTEWQQDIYGHCR